MQALRRQHENRSGLYTEAERRRRDSSPWTMVQAILATLQFLLDLAEFQDRAPAARPGIARAGAVGVNGDRGQRTHATSPEVSTP